MPRTPAVVLLFALAAACPAADPVTPRWDESAARHLLSRACFGGTPEQARALAAVPLEKAVDALLDDAATADGRRPARSGYGTCG
jgi:hypothetical protein